ncbi:MAG TPA: Gfo/Idh/MocA family oxidoreductase, partial [Armatimonadota bacterium]|nr:Gfo/Idh/MocA family oxidoreductase [Armatimonadota bacterium]
MASKKPIKLGIVGLGRSGYNIHVKRVRDDKRYQVTAVTDWLPERRAEVAEELGCECFDDHQALLKGADADVVVVASYSDTHGPITKDVLRSGRHAICEKPIADSVSMANSMVAAAKKAKKKLLVHHNNRYNPCIQHILKVIREKRIGDVFEIRMRSFGFSRRNDWQTMRSHHGGVLNNTCPHYIDAGLQMLGSTVKDVFCDLRLISGIGYVEDHVKVLLRAENGRVFDMEVSSACKFPEPLWTVLGSEGTLVSDGRTSTIESFDPKKLAKLEVVEEPPPGRAYGNDDVIPWQSEE